MKNIKNKQFSKNGSYIIKLSLENQEIFRREEEFAKRHRHDTDEELLEYLKDIAEKFDKLPTKKDVIGYTYMKSRFGPWPRLLEKAGLKPVSKKQLAKEKKRKKYSISTE